MTVAEEPLTTVKGFQTEPPPQTSGRRNWRTGLALLIGAAGRNWRDLSLLIGAAGRNWRTGLALLIGAAAVVVTLVVVALAVQELGPTATLWWIVAAAAVFNIVREVRLRRLTADAFMHVKDLIKVERWETYKSQQRQHALATRRLGRRRRAKGVTARGVYASRDIRWVNPRWYIKLRVSLLPLPQLQDIRSITVRWTPLIRADEEFLNQLLEAVANFLHVSPGVIVTSSPNLLQRKVKFALR